MHMIDIKNNGKMYGRCYVNKRIVVDDLYYHNHILCRNDFSNDRRMNVKIIKRKRYVPYRSYFGYSISKYKAHNLLDNEKFSNKGKSLVIE